MKTIILKTILIINLLFLYNCKAQTTSDYISFYNGVVPKLNTLVSNKTQFYGQNFSNFYNELLNKQVGIVMLNYDTKTDLDTELYVLTLTFSETNMLTTATENSFQYPIVSVTFENEIPSQIKTLVTQYQAKWNPTFAQFFANMKIEKIKFIGINGYNSSDRTVK
ncbi:hypothetical protein MUU74_02660 [Chryseobacterium daecheongense]|uniref:hypothetical protein n=1 Tax=Chryseobacterium daecheongense TaxID=192389 RepID=UPI001FD6DBD8|nr:hypothetical protein [Chryseobacterium daecheongense]UOU98860.1 hypothetical protein MUU74_02660 [Chryseobacterium daecheongense]